MKNVQDTTAEMTDRADQAALDALGQAPQTYPYTVIGHFEDNGEVWVAHVAAISPDAAACAAVIGIINDTGVWDDVDPEDIAVSDVFNGHHRGLLDSAYLSHASDLLKIGRDYPRPPLGPVGASDPPTLPEGP